MSLCEFFFQGSQHPSKSLVTKLLVLSRSFLRFKALFPSPLSFEAAKVNEGNLLRSKRFDMIVQSFISYECRDMSWCCDSFAEWFYNHKATKAGLEDDSRLCVWVGKIFEHRWSTLPYHMFINILYKVLYSKSEWSSGSTRMQDVVLRTQAAAAFAFASGMAVPWKVKRSFGFAFTIWLY